jgi:hypothetical protein
MRWSNAREENSKNGKIQPGVKRNREFQPDFSRTPTFRPRERSPQVTRGEILHQMLRRKKEKTK